jgi:hypothetical protein
MRKRISYPPENSKIQRDTWEPPPTTPGEAHVSWPVSRQALVYMESAWARKLIDHPQVSGRK